MAGGERLLRAGAQVDAVNEYGVTPLLLASTNGSARMIGALLNAGADPNRTLPNGETPLMWAARAGRADAVSALLTRGARVDARERTMGQTALMWAVALDHTDVAKTLLAHSADVNARSVSGFTPLMFAARDGRLDTARVLVAAGANVNEAAGDGTGALLVATVRGHAELAEFLLDRGADPTRADKRGFTPLHWAAGKWENLQTYSYPNLPGEWGALLEVPRRRLELIKALLAHGANPNARLVASAPKFGSAISRGPSAGATPFFVAATGANLDSMRLLLAAGADPRIAANDGRTPLMVAAGAGRAGDTRYTEDESLAVVTLLLDLGADVNAADAAGDTALHAVAFLGYDRLLQFLVDRGARVSPRNKKGETPLRIAAGGTMISGMVQSGSPATAALLRTLGGTVD